MYTGIVEPHFRHFCSIRGYCGVIEITQVQKLQNRAARIVTGTSFDAPSRPLVNRFGLKTLDELIVNDCNIMVLKSLRELLLQHMCQLFSKTFQQTSRNLRNIAMKTPKMDKIVFH